jgi:hypothetical protein
MHCRAFDDSRLDSVRILQLLHSIEDCLTIHDIGVIQCYSCSGKVLLVGANANNIQAPHDSMSIQWFRTLLDTELSLWIDKSFFTAASKFIAGRDIGWHVLEVPTCPFKKLGPGFHTSAIFLVFKIVVILSHALHNLHKQILVHPKAPAKFLQCIYCIIKFLESVLRDYWLLLH